MFTHIKLRNFMSFKEVIFDFREKSSGVKKFISIYGANGSDKSNFVNSIEFLLRSINSLSHSDMKESEISDSYCCKSLEHNIIDSKDIKKYKMLGCEGLTSVVYGFVANSHKGCYCLSFDNKVIRESLEYYEGKQKIRLFGIEYKNGKIVMALSNKLCLTQKVKEGLDSLWGTHTFLSIINKERKNENRWQTQDNLLGYISDVLDMLQSITIYKSGRILNTNNSDNILKNLCTGEINIKYANMLDSSERILKEFFTQTYSDIKDVFYKRNIVGKGLRYNLFIRKMIGGKLRMIDFNTESNGTKYILKIIYALLMVFFNKISIYSNLDNSLHD